MLSAQSVVYSLWAVSACFLLLAANEVLRTPQGNNLIGNYQTRELLELSSTASWLHDLPRRTVNGKEVDPTLFITGSGDYLSSLWAIAAVPVAIGVLGVIIFSCFLCIRFGFDGCGGKKPPEDGYTNRHRRVVKVVTWVLSLVILAMVIAGLVGNNMIAPTLDDFGTTTTAEAEQQRILLESIEPRLMEISNRTAQKGYVPVVTEAGVITVETANSGKSSLEDSNMGRELLLGFSHAFVVVTLILGLIGSIFNFPKVSFAAACVGAFAMFLIWFNFAIHFPVSAVVSDMCNDITVVGVNSRLDDRVANNGTFTGGVMDICECPSWANTLKTYEWATQLYNETEDELASTPANETQTRQELEAELMEISVIMDDVQFVLECRWMDIVFTPYGDEFCGKTMDGTVLIWCTSFIIAMLLIPYIILSVMGLKRWSRDQDGGFF